jgi:two-component system sensor histidine kinase/response regulator
MPAQILVVDDNAENRALAKAALEDEGHQVVLASTGDEGIAKFVEHPPDCVLLDVRMPGTDGFAVCAKIRSMPGGADTPIVFITALRDVETFEQALRVGGDDFLTRPVRPTELIVRVQAALKLRRMSAELREHYDLVRHQRDDLMRLQLQKERLTAFVVHDLKNPVNAMDLHAQVLLTDRNLSDLSRSSALHIRSEARSLTRLLLNLLDISKSEEGRLTARSERIDLPELAAGLLDAFAIKARTNEQTLVKDIRATGAMGDPDLLRRVLENLIDNALRHAPPKSEVRLTTLAVDGRTALRVADAGPGISAGQREAIFERFVQLEGSNLPPTRAGRGLGLAFCKLAVEAQGGKLWVEDANPGSVFCVTLPAPP